MKGKQMKSNYWVVCSVLCIAMGCGEGWVDSQNWGDNGYALKNGIVKVTCSQKKCPIYYAYDFNSNTEHPQQLDSVFQGVSMWAYARSENKYAVGYPMNDTSYGTADAEASQNPRFNRFGRSQMAFNDEKFWTIEHVSPERALAPDEAGNNEDNSLETIYCQQPQGCLIYDNENNLDTLGELMQNWDPNTGSYYNASVLCGAAMKVFVKDSSPNVRKYVVSYPRFLDREGRIQVVPMEGSNGRPMWRPTQPDCSADPTEDKYSKDSRCQGWIGSNTINEWIFYNPQLLLDEHHELPENYVPSDLINLKRYFDENYKNVALSKAEYSHFELDTLRTAAAAAFFEMYLAARAEGVRIFFNVGSTSYRSHKQGVGSQCQLKYYSGDSANAVMPGHSEHQLGLAADLGTTDGYAWMEKNAYRFGFDRTYDNYSCTGFNETWHWRFVGKPIATFLYYANLRLMEFLSRRHCTQNGLGPAISDDDLRDLIIQKQIPLRVDEKDNIILFRGYQLPYID